ncbi:MAG: peptidoglycan binding domain-containing protein, partial [Anaerolineae bacterium]
MSKDTRRAVAGIAIALTACVALGTVFLGYPALYADRIYPGVSVQDIHLAGLSVDQATALLANRLSPPSGRALDLTGIERSWHLDWDDVGRRYDPARTADEAYEAGRSGIWLEQVLAAWRIRLHGASIQPRVEPADPAQVRALLDSIAAQIHVPPTEAAVHIGTNRVTCVPGEAGRVLDVEATTSHVIAALADGTPEVELVTVARQPEVREAEPGCTRARTLLSRPFTLIADDPLTDYRSAFEAPPERMASWLRARPASDHVMLDVKEAAVEAWLLEIAPQLGSERILDLEETLRRTMAALEDGELQARTAIRHPQHTYVVQPGDTLFDIAYNHGFPQWRLEEANPEVGPDELLIGMEL